VNRANGRLIRLLKKTTARPTNKLRQSASLNEGCLKKLTKWINEICPFLVKAT